MTQEVAPLPTCEVIILTALPVEFRAVVAYLQKTQEIIHPQGTIYRVGSFVGKTGYLRVAVAQIGMGGMSAAAETERAIHLFHPQISLFVGIAGGLKDVQLGDVVAATKVYAYESGKVGQTFEPRPEVWRASYPLEQRARHEVSKEGWLARFHSFPDPVPHAHIGALAAGEKVLASTQADIYTRIKTTYGDALAVEMEGHGFLQAVHVNHNMHGLVIRGISDLLDDKAAADASGLQSRAAHHAAVFAFHVLATFSFPPSTTISSSTHSSVWNVPYRRNRHFTGRDELLNQLDQQLSPAIQEHITTMSRVALTQPQAIKGLGGIGKTQIAVEYAYRSHDLDRYTHTFWINAASEEVLLTSFTELAKLLPSFSVSDEADPHKLIEAIKRWLEQCQQSWLLIFDNADEVALVYSYLPQRGNGSILLTTRANAVGSLATSIAVETMGFIEGTHLLLHRAQRLENASDEEINQAGNIVVALDHFPLALDQAGAYIEETRCSFVDYLKLYQTHRQTLLAHRGALTIDYPYSVATTWSLSFQKIEQANPAAAELLCLCAFLAPDRIPEGLLKDGAVYWSPLLQNAATDLSMFQQMIAELLKFSLVKRLTDDHTLSIHRLVQAVQRDRMEPEIQHHWAERVVRVINDVFPRNPRDMTTWSQYLRYLDQAQACHMLIENYTLSFIEAACLLNHTGLYLYYYGLYTQAKPLYMLALAIYRQQLGVEHPDVANTLNNLALLYTNQGEYAQAEALYMQAVTIQEQQLGVGILDTASTLNNLALLYTNQDKCAQAESLYKRALAIQEQQLGPGHLDIANLLNNLAMLYTNQAKYTQAEPLLVRALVICERQLDAWHPTTALSLNNLALLYSHRGKYAKAESFYIRALEINERQLGAEHPDTAQGLNNLALLYEKQGKYAKAEPLLVRSLKIREQQLGDKHPDTACGLNNLAAVYLNQKKHAEAESLLIRALAICEQQLGTKHTGTAQSFNNLAMLYVKQEKYAEAEPLLEQALAIYENIFGRDHPHTQTIRKSYAFVFRTMECKRKRVERKGFFGLFGR